MRTYVIGDIHGCFNEFINLLNKELENFLSSLEPKWEDPDEFKWLKNVRIPSLVKKIKYSPSSRTNY